MDNNDTDDDYRQSADDALEPQDDLFNPRRDEKKLPEDYDTPTAPATDIYAAEPVDSPETDDGIDSDELYQEGIVGATNTDDEAIDSDDEDEPKPLDGYDES